jgi:2-polyprenyl-3-methyl-5-hydroxy-6-metoxy-1,4-benzoquinol methylase
MTLYEKFIELYSSGMVNAGLSNRLPDYGQKRWLNEFEKAIKLANPTKFIDIGAGDGRLCTLLLSYNSTITGAAIEINYNKYFWDVIKNKFKNRIEIRDGLLQDYLTEYKDIDFTILSEVFEHIPVKDVPNFLNDLNKIMKINGYVFLTTPNKVNQGEAEDSPIWHEKHQWGHHKHYNIEELELILKNHNFEIVNSTFECIESKQRIFNRNFYPIIRFDSRILFSKKIPKILKFIYKILTFPLIIILDSFYKKLAELMHEKEESTFNEKNCATIILTAKKVKDL